MPRWADPSGGHRSGALERPGSALAAPGSAARGLRAELPPAALGAAGCRGRGTALRLLFGAGALGGGGTRRHTAAPGAGRAGGLCTAVAKGAGSPLAEPRRRSVLQPKRDAKWHGAQACPLCLGGRDFRR